MGKRIKMGNWVVWVTAVWLGVCFLYSADALSDAGSLSPEMPAHWKVVTDFQVPAEQVNAMSSKLNAKLNSVRNIVYDVNGKRVQLNVMVTPDNGSAEQLMMRLRSIKAEETLLRKELLVFEFVGQNEVLPVIAEGRKHLDSK